MDLLKNSKVTVANEIDGLREHALGILEHGSLVLDKYSQIDNGLHPRHRREAATHLWPDFVSWKGVVKKMNQREQGHLLRNLYSLYVSLGVPVWRWIEVNWDAHHIRRIFALTGFAKIEDERLHGKPFTRVPVTRRNKTETVPADVADASSST